MKRVAGTVLVLCAAALAAADDEPKAPLAGAKQQLQQLQKDAAAAQSGTSDGGLKAVLPDLQSTLQGREVLPATSPDPNNNPRKRDREKERQRVAAKNWLVNEYNQLDPKRADSKKDDRLSAAPAGVDDENGAGPEAEDDFLKIYDEQAKPAASPPDAKGGLAAPSDPLAPFLQGWLANSPVRDAALASLPKPGAGIDAAGATPAPLLPDDHPGPAQALLNSLADTAPAASNDNPYLLNLTLPSVVENSPDSVLAPSVPSLDALPNASGPKPSVTLPADLAPAPVRLDQYKPPTTPEDEDKKYFPQLKRF